jgi:hypothetical protein
VAAAICPGCDVVDQYLLQAGQITVLSLGVGQVDLVN